jgi:hypothetical protein
MYVISKEIFNKHKLLFDGLVFYNYYNINEIIFKIAIPKYSKYLKANLTKMNIKITKITNE